LISASLDGTIKLWDFKLNVLKYSITIGSPISKIELNKDNGLLAVASDDFDVRVFDIDTRKLVRIFKGHQNIITDMSFNGDARWLASADSKSEIRVWDIPSGRCIDWFKTQSPVTSLDFSPRSDFLATSHVDSNAIYLW
jgi:U3 small nucleolar RNA-associated protein 21